MRCIKNVGNSLSKDKHSRSLICLASKFSQHALKLWMIISDDKVQNIKDTLVPRLLHVYDDIEAIM